MAFLHEAVAARNAFMTRFRGMPWMRDAGIAPAGTLGGYCVQVGLTEPMQGLPRHMAG
jgi:hypothetical protein